MESDNINSLESIKRFFHDIHSVYPLEWHPDDDFNDFELFDGSRAFSDAEAERLNKKMNDCFQYCDDNNIDVYDIAGEVHTDILRRQGIWPK